MLFGFANSFTPVSYFIFFFFFFSSRLFSREFLFHRELLSIGNQKCLLGNQPSSFFLFIFSSSSSSSSSFGRCVRGGEKRMGFILPFFGLQFSVRKHANRARTIFFVFGVWGGGASQVLVLRFFFRGKTDATHTADRFKLEIGWETMRLKSETSLNHVSLFSETLNHTFRYLTWLNGFNMKKQIR